MHGQRLMTQCLRTARGLCLQHGCLPSQHNRARHAGGCQARQARQSANFEVTMLTSKNCTKILAPTQGHCKPSNKVGLVQRRHAQDMVKASEKSSEAERIFAGDAQPCSTSSLKKGTTAAFLAKKGVLNSRGQLMLKSLTYSDLEQWCISVGVLPPSSLPL